jgi:hypothetical protein
MLSLIQGIFPAVNVLFELGRQGASFGQGRLEAYRLVDILHHVRLQNVQQVISCLDIIDQALHRVLGAEDTAFYGLDDSGHCFIAVQTQQNISRLWRDVVANRQIAAGGPADPLSTATMSIPQPTFQNEGDPPMANVATG